MMSASTLIIYRCGRRRREQCTSYSSGTWLLFNFCDTVYSLLWDGFLSKIELFRVVPGLMVWHGSSPASPASRVLMVQLRRLSTAIIQNRQLVEVVLAQTQRHGAARAQKQFTWSNTWASNSSCNWEWGGIQKQIQADSKSSFTCFVRIFILPKVIFQYLLDQRKKNYYCVNKTQ